MSTDDEVAAIRRLDALYVTAKRTNRAADWLAYHVALRAFQRGEPIPATTRRAAA